jgi:hypothetical protein
MGGHPLVLQDRSESETHHHHCSWTLILKLDIPFLFRKRVQPGQLLLLLHQLPELIRVSLPADFIEDWGAVWRTFIDVVEPMAPQLGQFSKP